MFIDGAALGVTLRLVMMAIVRLTGVLIAHLVRVARLGRGPALAGRPERPSRGGGSGSWRPRPSRSPRPAR